MRRKPFLIGILSYALTACRNRSQKESPAADNEERDADSALNDSTANDSATVDRAELEGCETQELFISLSDYPELRNIGGSAQLSFPEQFTHLLVVCVGENDWIAVWKICTHGDCYVEWDEAQALVRCPCHDSFFDIDGQVVQGPAERALKSYLVCEENERLYFIAAE